jgi:hypothetical protein
MHKQDIVAHSIGSLCNTPGAVSEDTQRVGRRLRTSEAAPLIS